MLDRVGQALAAGRRDRRGFTLVELLIAATTGLVVVGAAVTIFVSSIRSEPRTSSKVAAIQQGRTAMERITRELRQGVVVQTQTAAQLGIVTYVGDATCGGDPEAPCLVTYTCTTAGDCSRVVSETDGTSPGSSVQVVDGLSDDSVFTYSTSGGELSYVGVRLSFATYGGAGPVVLRDGVALRNLVQS